MRDSGIFPVGSPPPLQHPRLGKIQGRYNKGVIQYLGLKYATLEHRLARPQLASGLDKSDATKHGPPVLTPPKAEYMEKTFIQALIPEFDVPPMSDVDGLNLNVTVPLERGSDLPVLFYIHGGGYVFGSGVYSHYDQSKVVELSSIMDQPIVAVNINYRLGIPGFLSSRQLSDAGIPPNRGLLDQLTALEWVQEFIAGFGGDPKNVTVAGQSAGAASINYLMHSKIPLFNQAILLGGSFLMMRPQPMQKAEELFVEISRELGLDANQPEERLAALISMPSDKLTIMTPELVRLGPVVDHSLIPERATFSNLDNSLSLPGKTWCKRIFLIQSELDGSIFEQVNLGSRAPGIATAFHQYLNHVLGDKSSAGIMKFYDLKADETDALAVEKITNFITDIMFFAPAVELSRTWPGPTTLGLFNEHNPWDGPYRGKSNHLLDVAFMWGNFNQVYARENWKVARALAESVVAFACRRDALPQFKDKDRKVIVFGPSEQDIASLEVHIDDERAKRGRDIYTLAKEVGGLDILLDVAHGFLES